MDETDAELVHSVRRGDRRAAGRLLQRYFRACRAVALGSDSLWSLRVTLRGDTVRVFDDDDDDRDTGDDVDLDDLKSGTLAADGTLTVRLEDDRSTLVFRK